MTSEVTGLTVMAANLWHDWPRQHRWAPRLQAVADLAVAYRVDIMLLQEAARTRTMGADEWLARALGMERAYARANGAARVIGFEEGLAILSRYPLREPCTKRLSGSRVLARIALGAAVDTPLGTVWAVSVHLGLIPRRNASQLRVLRSWIGQEYQGEVAIIGGDFNAPATRHDIGELRREWVDAFHHSHGDRASSTHRRRRGRARERVIDYVFLQQPPGSGWQVVDAAHVDGPAGRHSDHRAVIAHIVRTRNDHS
jgi:endonuclease/exonuclease/phosphatase family metal-dependent hydrolase